MWLMSIVFTMLFVFISLFIDLTSFNTKMHYEADSNQAFLLLKNVHKAVSLLKDNRQTIEASSNCLKTTENNKEVSAECIDYGMNSGFSVKGKNSPLSRHVVGVIKHNIASQSYYYIYLEKGEKINHAVYSLIPKDNNTNMGFLSNGKIKNPIGQLACMDYPSGELNPCSDVPSGIPKNALVVIL
ncbi:hypothetical protein E2U54_23730 [Salmonella enterica]|nr:hypothetical protein [Salmonella enterica]